MECVHIVANKLYAVAKNTLQHESQLEHQVAATFTPSGLYSFCCHTPTSLNNIYNIITKYASGQTFKGFCLIFKASIVLEILKFSI